MIAVCGMGAFLAGTQYGRALEEELGLTWLFHLRGSLKSPADVIIISLDQQSADILRLPDNPDDWPRTFYATLLEKLARQNPALIAFNIHFGQSRDPEKDATLAQAMAECQNVVLSNYLKMTVIPGDDNQKGIYYEHIINPLDAINKAALGAAPFPLPKSSSTVKEFWTFKLSAGDLATFPVSIFQFFVLKKTYPELRHVLERIEPALLVNMPDTYEALAKDHLAGKMVNAIQVYLSHNPDALVRFETLVSTSKYSSETTRLLMSWALLLRSSKRLYLNYYGDVGAILTVPFYQVIAADKLNENLFRNKIVLVGYGEDLEPEKQQGFYSTYSRNDGQAICPIEIAGTAVANILDQSWLRPLGGRYSLALLIGWGLLLGSLFRFCQYRNALALTVCFTFAYFSASVFLFNAQYLWLPLAIPLMQALALIVWESISHYRQIRKLTAYYLPKEVFAIGTDHPDQMNGYGNLVEGVCLATDAGQYTALSEFVNPLELNKLMNDYYASIFPRVKKNAGQITDVIGDAMLAVWVQKKSDLNNRVNACRAALEIKAAVEAFNQFSPHALETRIGLHYGSMCLGNVGAMEHYEFRAVGDTVNTAARIEGLNKLLGTHVLVSAAVLEQVGGFITRELGVFLLKGKSNPMAIVEMIDFADESKPVSEEMAKLLDKFAQALQAFKSGKLAVALGLFKIIHRDFPNDGPALFYLNYLQQVPKPKTDEELQKIQLIDVGNIPTFLPAEKLKQMPG
jgi:adenylate cyclase